MTKPKTLEQLRAEKERAETQLAQEKHKLNRLENRKKYLEKGERQKRTHRLCNLGGTIESLAPEVKDLTRTEMTELMEYIFSLSEVQQAVRHMAITHISQANREKELKANGTICKRTSCWTTTHWQKKPPLPLPGITTYPGESRQQKSAWRRSPSCERTSSTMPRPATPISPTARPVSASDKM